MKDFEQIIYEAEAPALKKALREIMVRNDQLERFQIEVDTYFIDTRDNSGTNANGNWIHIDEYNMIIRDLKIKHQKEIEEIKKQPLRNKIMWIAIEFVILWSSFTIMSLLFLK